jgi:hypothetical protein
MWHLTNASGSASYDLQLVDDARQTPMIMQLVSVDGVSIHVPLDAPPSTVTRLGGARFRVVACPCHILEHEDGGMMAKIQVVPAAAEGRDETPRW